MIRFSRVLGWLLLFHQFAVAIGFTVSPPEVSAAVPVAQETTDVVTVQNTSATAVRFKAYLADWTVAATGADTVFEPNGFARSCSPWTQVNPVEFEIPPGAKQDVRVTVGPPPGAGGGYWCMLYVESAPIPSSWSSKVQLNARVGVRVFADIAGTEVRNCEMVDLRLDTGKDLRLTAAARNTGNTPVRLKGTMEIKGKDGKTVWQTECNQLALPGQEVGFSAKPDVPLPKGEYLAVLNVDYGGAELLVGERAVIIGQDRLTER